MRSWELQVKQRQLDLYHEIKANVSKPMLRQFWYFQGMIYSKTYSGNKDVRMASIGKAQEEMRKRVQCFLEKSEKQTVNPTVQSGSRISEG